MKYSISYKVISHQNLKDEHKKSIGTMLVKVSFPLIRPGSIISGKNTYLWTQGLPRTVGNYSRALTS